MKPHCFLSPSSFSFCTRSKCMHSKGGAGVSVYEEGQKDNGMRA